MFNTQTDTVLSMQLVFQTKDLESIRRSVAWRTELEEEKK